MQGTSKVPVLCVYSVSYLVSFFGAIRENGDMITISVFQCSILVFEGTRVGFILLDDRALIEPVVIVFLSSVLPSQRAEKGDCDVTGS